MKLIVLRSNLKSGLAAVERAVLENNNLPILKNVLIKTYNNKIKIAATNLELGITSLISGKIIEEGGITIPFNTLYNIVNNSDSERINLESLKNNLLFKTDNYEAKIQGIGEEEFPIIPKIESEEYYLEIDCNLFKNSLLKVAAAAQISEIRPEISGVLFDFQVTLLKLVATDAFRLAQKYFNNNQFKHNLNKGFKVIVPLKTITEVLRIFPAESSVKIFVDSNQILFQSNELELISRLIDGNYPDYEQIIPKSIDNEIIINKDFLINALKLVSNFSGKTNDIKIKTNENNKVLEIYSANQYLGDNKYLIPIKFKGKEIKEISFNWRYLLDGLKAAGSENVFFGVNDSARPSLIKSSDDESYYYILMPIKSV